VRGKDDWRKSEITDTGIRYVDFTAIIPAPGKEML
jgi:hypothetical protein